MRIAAARFLSSLRAKGNKIRVRRSLQHLCLFMLRRFARGHCEGICLARRVDALGAIEQAFNSNGELFSKLRKASIFSITATFELSTN